jgi:DNA helicase HerA-like ATPase
MISSNDRVGIFGRTGSGKTTLVKRVLLPHVRQWAVLDPKHEFTFPEARVRQKYDAKPEKVIYRAPEFGPGEKLWYDDIVARVMEEGKRLIVVDEAYFVTNSNPTSPGMARAMRMGRSKGTGVWLLTQSPTRVPHEMLSQTDHIFLFHLQHLGDQERVIQMIGKHIVPMMHRLTLPGHKHDFLYHNIAEHRTIYYHQPYRDRLRVVRAS